MGEVKTGLQLPGNGFVFSTLHAVFCGDGMDSPLPRHQQRNRGLPDGCRSPALDLGDERIHGLAFGHGDQGLLMVLADDGVHLPVPAPCLTVHSGRALINRDSVDQGAPALIAAIPLLPLLWTAPRSVRSTAADLILGSILIDPVMTATHPFTQAQPVRDLLRTSLALQPGFHPVPQRCRQAWGMARVSACLHQELGLAGNRADHDCAAVHG
ncbi:MAG: hypothetical protein ACRESK_08315 [Gammaproteobacteria bacterium]